jgi:spore coat protein CotH
MKKVLSIMIIFLVVFLMIGCDEVLIPSVPVIDNPTNETMSALDDPNYERLFSDVSKKTITIEITNSEYQRLYDMMIAHHQNFGDYRISDYVRSNIIYEDDQGIIRMNQVGFRTRGNFSRNRIQDDEGNIYINHYKLKFDETFSDTLNVSKRFLFGLEELDLKYNRNNDETYMNEHYAMDLYRSFGIHAQRTTHIMIYLKIDERMHSMGLYTAFEPIDQTFIDRRFEGFHAEGDLYKNLWQQFGPATLTMPNQLEAIGIKDTSINYRPAYDLKTNKNTSTHEALLTLMEAMTFDFEARQQFISNYVDISYTAMFFAVSLILGNPDDIRGNGNNYYLYIDPVENLYYLMPYDLDHSLGQGWEGAPAFENQLVNTPLYDYPRFIDVVVENAPSNVFIDTLFKMTSFRDAYEASLKQIIESEQFTFSDVSNRIDALGNLYHHDIEDAYNNTPIGYRDIETFITQKKESVSSQLQEIT